ncbi:sulfotransferase domain-containing protein [Rhodobacter sp. 140A]|nr:sulfotransferase domain-containing protein [Rhodobacter sp. 140A]
MAESFFPDFLIAGAMKAGTTSVADILSELPQISFSVPKEPTLLMRHDYEQQNPEFFVPAPAEMEATYRAHFVHARPNTLWGEGSVAYLADPDSPSLVTARNPDVKVVILLRDPLRRSLSAYHYSRSTFDEPASTMEQALEEELAGKRHNFWPTLRHMNYSSYPQHLRRWEAALKPGNLLLLEFEAYVRSPQESIARICDFLGIEVPERLPNKERSNVTVTLDTPLKRRVMQVMHTQNSLKSLIKPMLPRRFREKLKVRIQDRLAAKQAKSEPVSDWCANTMQARFAGMQAVLAEEFDFHPQYWTSGG